MKISQNFRKGCALALVSLLALPCLSLMRTQAAGAIDVDAKCTLTVSVDKTVLTDSELTGDGTLSQYKDLPGS